VNGAGNAIAEFGARLLLTTRTAGRAGPRVAANSKESLERMGRGRDGDFPFRDPNPRVKIETRSEGD
jgi:hypothetical protein